MKCVDIIPCITKLGTRCR